MREVLYDIRRSSRYIFLSWPVDAAIPMSPEPRLRLPRAIVDETRSARGPNSSYVMLIIELVS
jgi:hypothetical protein